MQKLQNPVGVLTVEFLEVASSFWQNFNFPHNMGNQRSHVRNCREKLFSAAA